MAEKNQKESKPEKVSEPRYKMNLYMPNGLLRPQISRSIFSEMSAHHGDIIRAISMSNWCTFEEIVASYANLSKRLKFEPFRTPEQIQAALKDMQEAGLVEVRT